MKECPECLEQARLNGMGSEREARLLARVDGAKRLLLRAVRRHTDYMDDDAFRREIRAWLADNGDVTP
jgi:hypothetical protein